MVDLAQPTIEVRAEQPYVAIGERVTMTTMVPTLPDASAVVDDWLRDQSIDAAGPPFWRYLVIDMERGLVVEVGSPTESVVDSAGTGRITSGVLPAGRYATVIHTGHPDSLVDATAALLNWAASQGERFDMVTTDDGEHWAARIEWYLTDPAEERDMTKWRTQLAFKLA